MILAAAARKLMQRPSAVCMRGDEPVCALKYVCAAVKPARGQFGGQQAAFAGLSCMQRLAHGPEHRFQSGRLRTGDAERRGNSAAVETAEMRACCSGAERTDGAGRMEAARIMAGRNDLADLTLGLVPGDESSNQVTTAGAA